MDLELVEIVHPNLPGRVVQVPKQSVPHHQRAGWELADPPDPQERVIQALVDGGLDPEEAKRIADAAGPPEPPPPTPEDRTAKAPETESPGLSHATDQPPRRRRAKEEGDA